MSGNRIFALAIALLLSIISTNSVASTKAKLIWCNGCNEQSEGLAAANEINKENTYPTSPTSGYIYVGNGSNIHKYYVRVESRVQPPHCTNGTCTQPQARQLSTVYGGGDGLIPEWSAVQQPVESSIQTAFESLTNFYNTAPVGWKKYFTVKILNPSKGMTADEGIKVQREAATFSENSAVTLAPVTNYPNPSVNAYDVVNRGAEQQRLFTYLKSGFIDKLNTEVDYATSFISSFHIIDKSVIPTIAIKVIFDDNSSVTAVLDTSTDVPEFHILPDSGRDSNNNPIPSTKSTVQGEGIAKYEFGSYASNPNDAYLMYNQILDLGVPIHPTVTVISSSYVSYISCHQDTCTVVWKQKQ